jgi:long-subunit fatty acid transport protein
MRAHLGIAYQPVPDVTLELMGGWVGWSAFRDFEIKVVDLEAVDTEVAEEDLARVEQDRLWARDNQDSFWLGIDAKGKPHDQLLVGGRVLFDRAAVPSYAMSPNNADFDTIQIGVLVAAQPSPKVPLEIGLSFTEHIQLSRTVTDSAFYVAVDPAARPEDRYTWPVMNGTYKGFIHRLGISLRGTFDDKPRRIGKAP